MISESPEMPSWAQEIVDLLPACSHFILTGNTRDKYFVSIDSMADGASERGNTERVAADESSDAVSSGVVEVRRFIPTLLDIVLRRVGFGIVLGYDISSGASVLGDPLDELQLTRAFAQAFGNGYAEDEHRRMAASFLGAIEDASESSLSGLVQLMEVVARSALRVAFVIQSASRLVASPTDLQLDEFQFFRRVERLMRLDELPPAGAADGHSWFNPVIWLLDSERDFPDWFVRDNVSARAIALPLPDKGQREKLARKSLPLLRGFESSVISPGDGDGDQALRTFRDQTAGLTLVAMERIIRIGREQGIGAGDIEDAIRFFRIGNKQNPWSSAYMLDAVRAEVRRLRGTAEEEDRFGGSGVTQRVLGQDRAVRKAMDILVRSAAGLTGAHASGSATRPRGILFLAGPTGVGKTELAKALAEMVFGDEERLIRFDMSEFSAEQSADRLVGAPPGYVGFNAGGELTNAIREQPFSVVLFDEIEKAHPRILDKFLQLLDDGRLTDGRGDTVHFNDAIVVFTTNLGVYREVGEFDDSGRLVGRHREVNVSATQGTKEERERAIRGAIQEYFEVELGRVELLNRIGLNNIVVFDFIGDSTARQMLGAMVSRVCKRVADEHGVELRLGTQAYRVIELECLHSEVLRFGGRGIGAQLETVLVNPVAEILLQRRLTTGDCLNVVSLEERNGGWVAECE